MFSRSPLTWLLKATESPIEDPRRVVWLRESDDRWTKVTIPYRYDPNACHRLEKEWMEARSTVEWAHRLCRERGVGFALLYLPTSIRVLKDRLRWDHAEAEEKWCPGGEVDVPGDLAHRMADFCDSIQCPMIDATHPLCDLARRRPESVFVRDESHLDLAGHERVAELLAAWVDQSGTGRAQALSAPQPPEEAPK